MIGVLGASGEVGRAVVARLVGRGPVRAGARRRPPGPGAQAVDVHDPHAIERFLADLAVVVDATGPARETGRVVAAAAARAGIPLVAVGEAAGDAAPRPIPRAPAVVGAGLDPGLTGLFPRAVAARAGEGVVGLTAWTAVHDRFGPVAAHEWVDAVEAGARLPGTAWRGVGPARITAPAPDPFAEGAAGLPPSCAAVVALGAPEEATARALGLAHGTWVSVLLGPRVAAAMAGLAALPRDEAVALLVRESGADLGADDPAAVLAVELTGRAPLAAALRGAGNAALSAAVAVATVDAVLAGEVGPGVHRAAEVLDPARTLERVLAAGDACCAVTPGPVVEALEALPARPSGRGRDVEEGVL